VRHDCDRAHLPDDYKRYRGRSELNEQLYEAYVKEQRLHVTIAEMLQAKRETA